MSDLIERTAVLDLMRTNWADNDGDTAMQLSIDDVRNMPAASADEMPAVDAVKRESVLNTLDAMDKVLDENRTVESYKELLKECYKELPPVTPKQRLCKDCRYFEYDHVKKVDGITLILAHEICKKWGGGCQTREDGYCFLFEPKEGESE